VRKLHYDLEPLNEDFIVKAINMEVRNLPELFYQTPTYEKQDMLLFEEHYKEQCVKNPYLYDGIAEILQELSSRNIKLSVATNAPTKFAKRMLSSLNVADMFDVIIGADKVSKSKPNPEMLHEILKFYKYDADKDKAWMVGDNSKDMQSAKNANIMGLFATWGFSPTTEYEIKLSEPAAVVSWVLT